MNPIKIGIVDDHRLFREGLIFVIEQNQDLKVILEAEQGQDLLDQLASTPKLPDIILMDIRMPVMDGLECTQLIKKQYPSIKIITVTTYDQVDYILYLLKLGVNGYLRKIVSGKEICHAIRATWEQEYYFDSFVTQIMLDGLKRKRNFVAKPKIDGQVNITPREQEVLELILKEYTTQEIADRLFVSIHTVETHRKKLFNKFGVKNVVGLVVRALQMRQFSVA
ncbi:response regulator transcription factor [Microscilla marina]|uniref:DNA-binding response regulator, LuxR family n=1 Tax=Microscilla marina ATCC 23134 TaxID=313606 RepID=A1ZMB7_MICM2|nr:response regulator transcription factor [Microscilla marina]EAY28297.1 DNA-binding response regulator, LuxR family [Microscilla marina ATCC 23134]